MNGRGEPPAGPFDAFEQRTSQLGLLRRYARGRIRNFGNRQIMTVAGGVMLWIMNGPISGFVAIVAALIGEGIDCLYLSSVDRRLEAGESPKRVYAISAITAGIQAITISICTGMAWFGTETSASPLFSIAFLAGAAANSGLVQPFHRLAAGIRLTIYALDAILLFVLAAILRGPPDAKFSMDAVGTLMLGFMVFAFLDHVISGFHRHNAANRAVIDKSVELEKVNRQLAARQKEAHRLSLVARNANDSVLLLDRNDRITWVNDAFTRTTGYGLGEAIGRKPSELLNGPGTDMKVVAALNQATAAGIPFRGELLNRTKVGKTLWMETNQVPVLDEEGHVDMVIAIERDITAAKQHEREMIVARQAAEEGARAKSEFLATMSHEIRTPLNGVIGMADLLAETGLTADQYIYTDTIRGSAQALLTIINDVLDLSRLDAHKVKLDPVDFNLKACVQGPVRLLRPLARDKGLWLHFDYRGGTCDWLHGDDSRLRQILINLIGNAIKFTQSGGVTVRVCNVCSGDESDLRIDVEDTGIGIPEEKHELIFERFAQADASTTRQYGGTGLGLTIARLLIEEMGGRISLESEPGKGSLFSIRLPLPCAKKTPATTKAPEAVPQDAAGPALLAGKRVLVADDAEINRVLMGKFFKGLDVTVLFAHDGREAVDLTLEQEPDIVLMDMSMPRLNGIEATRRIRREAVKQPAIIALTANAFDTDKEACLAAGMDGYLAKPVRRAELLTCMAEQAARLHHVPAQ